MSLLPVYKDIKDALEEQIRELYTGQINAGVETLGQYANRIHTLEKQLTDINKKIANEAEKEFPVDESGNGPIKIIKIFLASSAELKADREEFEIFINRENKQLIDRGIFLHLVLWEDFVDALSATRLQDEYDRAVKKCDLFVSLFFTKTGPYTEEEFDTALASFRSLGKPLVYTYFKDPGSGTQQSSLADFKEKLRKLGHFPTSYNSAADLKYYFKMQLDKTLPLIVK